MHEEDADIRHDWSQQEVEQLHELPFSDLVYRAQGVHRRHFDPNAVQASTLLSIKTGACPEDCSYCPQSARYKTGLQAEPLMDADEVEQAARRARDNGATRFCMGAAWRSPRDRDLPRLQEMIRRVKALGLESCMTLGMLSAEQARALAEAGLDYYNHNLDTSAAYYGEIITTRSYQDRLDTLEEVRAAGMKVCCGGIVGMGESRADRCSMLRQLANMPQHPESVPINMLVRVPGTPLAEQPPMPPLEFVRVVAVARILMPRSHVRLSAGRGEMSEELQALAFVAGANSVFYGDQLLTTPNAGSEADQRLFARLGVQPGDAPLRETAALPQRA